METGIELISKERKRQIEIEGWSQEHDDRHRNEEMARAAMCYANPIPSEGFITAYWPWEKEWWKPKKDTIPGRIIELAKAGSLCAAEIDRLARIQKGYEEKELINEIEQLILHAEDGSLDYSVLEHARKLVFKIKHPKEYDQTFKNVLPDMRQNA